MSTMTKSQIDDVLKDVQARLDKHASADVSLKVESARLEDDGWLIIVVSPAREGIRAYHYVETLSKVEQELRKEHQDKVILVPAIAD